MALLGELLIFAHVLGLVSAVHALLRTRTPQGTIAWVVSLLFMPALSVPAYWVFGRYKFHGYITARRDLATSTSRRIQAMRESLDPWIATLEGYRRPLAGERLAQMPFLGGNAVELLVDGAATFDSIFAGIAAAQRHVLVQFYIVHDDQQGRELARRLAAKARDGVTVRFLYDEIGCAGLPGRYLKALAESGVLVHAFNSSRGLFNRFQINFRNHRKVVVVDGLSAWIGGHNVGDEYMGRDPGIGPWRDTHVKITGPAVIGAMISFAEDWRWSTGEELEADWAAPGEAAGDAVVLTVATGPADDLESASLMYQQGIQSARERVWIATPYFVPDQALMHTLHLAALRGVDVRILIPERPDHRLVYYSAFAFMGELLRTGVRIFRYRPGFLHEKVMLIDDGCAVVGTANFDNRSFRLNFEIMAVVLDRPFVAEVDAMFRHDFAQSREITGAELEQKSLWFRVLSRAAYLTAPVQ